MSWISNVFGIQASRSTSAKNSCCAGLKNWEGQWGFTYSWLFSWELVIPQLLGPRTSISLSCWWDELRLNGNHPELPQANGGRENWFASLPPKISQILQDLPGNCLFNQPDPIKTFKRKAVLAMVRDACDRGSKSMDKTQGTLKGWKHLGQRQMTILTKNVLWQQGVYQIPVSSFSFYKWMHSLALCPSGSLGNKTGEEPASIIILGSEQALKTMIAIHSGTFWMLWRILLKWMFSKQCINICY